MISVVQVSDNWHLFFLLPIVSRSCSSFLYKIININLHILDRKGIQAIKSLLQKIVHGTDFMQGRWKVYKCRGEAVIEGLLMEQVCLCTLLLAKSGGRVPGSDGPDYQCNQK